MNVDPTVTISKLEELIKLKGDNEEIVITYDKEDGFFVVGVPQKIIKHAGTIYESNPEIKPTICEAIDSAVEYKKQQKL